MTDQRRLANVEAGWRAWFVVISGAFFYCYQFVLRVSPNVMTEELMRAFSIDATYLGFFSSCYYISYSAAMIPLGILMDRFGPRKMFFTGSLLCAFSCFLFSYVSTPFLACIARLIMGIGAASGFLGTLKLGTLWLPASRFGQVIALAMVFGTLGAVIGGAPLEHAFEHLGWRAVIVGMGVIGVLLSLVYQFLIKEKKVPQVELPGNVLVGLRHVMTSGQVWKSALYGMLMYLPLVIMGDLWGVSFLQKLFGPEVSEPQAASVVAAMFIGISVGCPTFAMFSDVLRKRRLPMLIGTSLCLLSYLGILYWENIPFSAMYALFFMTGFFFGGKSLSFATVVESLPLAISGVAIGFANMLVMVSGMIGLPLVGYLLDLSNKGQRLNGIANYSITDFRFALSIIPFCIFISLLLASRIKETHPQRR